MTRESFEDLLDEILDSIPDEFAEKLENVEFIVHAQPNETTRKQMKLRGDETLLGLYQGVPFSYRSPTWYAGVLPDRIIIYQKNIEAVAGRGDRVKTVLRRTLLHEVAHYFGISDKRLREIGAY
ncbi:MAG: metallopeptidase family protein [Pseudomonadota bacterium]